MSEDECYFSDQSNLIPQTPATSSSYGYTYENEQELEQEYIYDYEYQSSEYVMYEETAEEIPYIIPKATKKVIWKRPQNNETVIPKSRKRPSVAEEEELPPPLEFHGNDLSAEHLPPPTKKSQTKDQLSDKAIVNFYLQDIRKRSESFKPKRPTENCGDIFERLEQAGNCDVHNRQCLFPTCNRRFISIEVLAYHVSYAHQQCNGKKNGAQICLICGSTFSTVQGKLSHMTSTHKKLANEHGRLCLLQGPNTIVF